MSAHREEDRDEHPNLARRRTHRVRRSREVELNLIPLIDIMSVMVAFLLVYSADVEVIQNSKGVRFRSRSRRRSPRSPWW